MPDTKSWDDNLRDVLVAYRFYLGVLILLLGVGVMIRGGLFGDDILVWISGMREGAG